MSLQHLLPFDGPSEADDEHSSTQHEAGSGADDGAGSSSLSHLTWAAGLYTEATDLQPSRLLFTVIADLPRQTASQLPSRMVVKDYRFRSDIPVTQMRGNPIVMRLPHNASNTQRKVVERLLNAHMAVIVPLDDMNFIVSPERVQGQVMLIGVLAEHTASSPE